MSNIIAIKYNGILTYSYLNISNIFKFLTEEEFEEINSIITKYDNKGIYLNTCKDSYDFSIITECIEDIDDINIINKYFQIIL